MQLGAIAVGRALFSGIEMALSLTEETACTHVSVDILLIVVCVFLLSGRVDKSSPIQRLLPVPTDMVVETHDTRRHLVLSPAYLYQTLVWNMTVF